MTSAKPRDRQSTERQIRSLSDRSGAPLAEVRALFNQELARLEIGARVGSYLGVLTAANVRGMLRRKARLAAEAKDAEASAAAGGRVAVTHR